MNYTSDVTARSEFQHGTDCIARFLRRKDNEKAKADVWEITMSGQTFLLDLMKMWRKPDAAPWVFGSIYTSPGKQRWTFRQDPRVQKGFAGDVFTVVAADGHTTLVTFNFFGDLKHTVTLAELLKVEQPQKPQPAPAVAYPSEPVVDRVPAAVMAEPEQDPMGWFIERVLQKMCPSPA